MSILKKSHKQQGATLITSLMMLMIMTTVGVTAIKTSSVDILIANNDQRQMLLFQQKESELIKLSNPATLLLPWLEIDGAKFTNNEYVIPSPSIHQTTVISKVTDLKKFAACSDSELGPGIPPCRLFDFNLSLTSQFKGAKAAGSRGVGKEVPALNKYVLGN